MKGGTGEIFCVSFGLENPINLNLLPQIDSMSYGPIEVNLHLQAADEVKVIMSPPM